VDSKLDSRHDFGRQELWESQNHRIDARISSGGDSCIDSDYWPLDSACHFPFHTINLLYNQEIVFSLPTSCNLLNVHIYNDMAKTTTKKDKSKANKPPGKPKSKKKAAEELKKKENDEKVQNIGEIKYIHFSLHHTSSSWFFISWTHDCMWLLVNEIDNNEDIKNGLYPVSGGNASLSKGGSKPKAKHHWALAFHIFGNDVEYKEMINAAIGVPKQRAVWGLCMKNKLSR